MSHEVNVKEVFYGTIAPGVEIEFYDWEGSYDSARKRAWFSTVAPDPLIDGKFELFSTEYNLQVTATWSTVWLDANGKATYQRNTRMANIGGMTAAYHIIRAETDN